MFGSSHTWYWIFWDEPSHSEFPTFSLNLSLDTLCWGMFSGIPLLLSFSLLLQHIFINFFGKCRKPLPPALKHSLFPRGLPYMLHLLKTILFRSSYFPFGSFVGFICRGKTIKEKARFSVLAFLGQVSNDLHAVVFSLKLLSHETTSSQKRKYYRTVLSSPGTTSNENDVRERKKPRETKNNPSISAWYRIGCGAVASTRVYCREFPSIADFISQAQSSTLPACRNGASVPVSVISII